MINLEGELSAAERVVLAIDTSDLDRAHELAGIAKAAGASLIKQGLQLSSAPGSSWENVAQIAAEAGLGWVADTKGDDIGHTIEGFMTNIVSYPHPPVAITMQTHAGVDAMIGAQRIASEHGIVMLGVTELTSVKEPEFRRQVNFILTSLGLEGLPPEIMERPLEDPVVRRAIVHMRATEAASAGLRGLVASANELIDPIRDDPRLRGMFTMIPGTRSPGAETHDQHNVDTPESAIVNGANLLVIGREVTGSSDPTGAFQNVVAGIQRGLERRS